jgi:hypothetical protein
MFKEIGWEALNYLFDHWKADEQIKKNVKLEEIPEEFEEFKSI